MTTNSLRFAGYLPPASVHSRAATVFGDSVTRQLGATVDFQLEGNVIDSGRNAADLLTMVESGEIEMCYFSTSYLAARVPEFALLDLPFVVTDRDQAYRVLDGALGDLLSQRLAAATGMMALAFWDNGFRHISNRVRPIRTPEDCVGLTIRTLSSELHSRTFRALGFVPVTLDVRDLIAAVRAGTIDAQDNALTNYYNFAIHDHHRYITLTAHFFGVAALLCNKSAYESWSAEIRDTVTVAVAEATRTQRRFASEEDAHMLAKLRPEQNEVLELSVSERESFRSRVAAILESERRRFGDSLFDLLQEAQQ